MGHVHCDGLLFPQQRAHAHGLRDPHGSLLSAMWLVGSRLLASSGLQGKSSNGRLFRNLLGERHAGILGTVVEEQAQWSSCRTQFTQQHGNVTGW